MLKYFCVNRSYLLCFGEDTADLGACLLACAKLFMLLSCAGPACMPCLEGYHDSKFLSHDYYVIKYFDFTIIQGY